MSKKSVTLSQAYEGMIRYKQATGKSENTIADYRVDFEKLFCYFKSDPPIHAIKRGEITEFFAWLQEDYLTEPDGVAPRSFSTKSTGTQAFNLGIQFVDITFMLCFPDEYALTILFKQLRKIFQRWFFPFVYLVRMDTIL